MQEVIQNANLELHSNAYAALNAAQLFTDEEIRYLDEACQIIPKTIIEIGDVGEQNYLSVGRFMEDQKGQLPQYRNDPYGKRVVEILSSGKSREFFNGIMQGECFIRRCQSNLLEAGNFIGKHIDTYSNLEYRYSVVIQFGKQYEGGEFFIEHEGRESQLKTGYADVLINRCEIPHGVNKVQSGTRASLVFFLSTTPLDKPNLHNKQI
ncbi:2-oxoglutarate-Fe(II)-dependent oxygenase superfamily protein [Pseudomonas sp. SJZ079]|uniref:2OG-Fe(II) oxygenase n=1 Tax=Pseudomonas sp. SJZ079 TaxID=2572887 RepID=UPI00119A99E9|nr:2OG-Fe(II) oxygenase [Pseudomonas sp. SJZ079]TWC37738.1 2-oxoglutarate-Fe(II)-dependent oxygenase superfamily protein [Pseudomonas sp. SJZ079]